jgi:Cof subfamily protein (haloacid dehalogenase superfamily)
MIKLIAMDLDDTLFRSDLTISWWSRRILKRAAARGVEIVPASGRTPESLMHYTHKYKLQHITHYYIAENGSLILNGEGAAIDKTLIPAKVAMTAYKLVDAEGFAIQKYSGGTIFVSRSNEFTDYDKKLTGLNQIVAEDFAKVVETGCTKLVIPGDPMTLKPLEDILRTYIGNEATIFTSKPYFLEILSPVCDKGTALAKIAQMANIQQDEVMAFGDSMNDEAMLRWAGIGVCMRNGDERMKKIARIVTGETNNDDGVARTIRQYVLKGEKIPDREAQ